MGIEAKNEAEEEGERKVESTTLGTRKVEVCAKTECGERKQNEDRFTYVLNFEDQIYSLWTRLFSTVRKVAYFGVYDGHDGMDAAQQASDDLHRCIARNINHDTFDIETAIREGYSQFDSKFCENVISEHAKDPEKQNSSGSCAVSVIMDGSTVYVANIGDCAAVICRNGTPILLSDEHAPRDNPQEQERVINAGGTISCDGRLNGDLNVSRAFGDVKGYQNCGEGPRKMTGLTSEPVIKKHTLTEEDEFIIIACDGIFDFVNYKTSVQTVRRTLRRTNDIEAGTQKLIEYATKVKSSDNMTCMIVGFPKPDEEGVMRIVKPFKRSTPPNFRRRRFILKSLNE